MRMMQADWQCIGIGQSHMKREWLQNDLLQIYSNLGDVTPWSLQWHIVRISTDLGNSKENIKAPHC